ncbi:MAG: hypothetical protein COW00_01285 [Bdellovibrio sp. CG12_big_fil_rev_8_21_14_0_65_39_13]|nr:MAG: hypothetical protein COW78_17415 [Bdellovibrio sp. CG22_combo_CG10-13_8_21_14_all_39_27]PIQ62599.1 MAG: hypothetical protein COW00_01285 [Bdellovibrio sp. CG12_big_fil_rev_8_21_14_0_65_39_13]PIR36954.1 MAG: hypothetical protein COV37_00240 [Bdellovibrio sp. CG11_big_fil_rev_8_21_14_0_20_39_38]
MNISVSKDNQIVLNIDLSQEVSSLGNSEAVFYIGRAKDCTIVLDDRTISRVHAELHYGNRQWKLIASSGFGSLLVNGQPIQDKVLEPGDSASCGPYILNFQFSHSENVPVAEEIVEEAEVEDLIEVEDASPEMTETFIEEAPQVEMITEEDAGLVQEEEFDDDFGDNVQEEAVDDSFGEETSEISSEDATDEDDISFDNGDEDFAIIPEDDEGDDLNESTRVLQTFVDLYFEISGEYAPYDKFKLDDKEVFIGRDPSKCKLVINDPEISSVHAVIRKNNITCTIEDLQSANGTLVNGEAVNKQDLSNGDEVLLGSTTLTLRIKSDFFKQEEDRLMPVEEGQEIEVQEIVEVDEDFDDTGMQEFGDQAGAPKSKSLFSKEALKDPVKRKKLLYGLIGLLALWVLLDEEPAKKPVPKQSKEDARLLESQKQGVNTTNPNEKKLTPEELAMVESTYLLAKELIDVGKFNEALIELDKIKRIQASYKNTLQLEALAKQKIAEIEALNRKQREEEEKRLRMEKVKLLVEEAKTATEKKQVQLAEGLFAKIIELDPENFEVSRLKLEIDSYKREQERIEIERAAKEAERKRQLDALAPGKGHYLKSEWYKAIQRLSSFLLEKSIDEDLRDEATKMLTESKDNLNAIIQPMLGKARSLKEGQDLKGAYEQYAEILKLDQGSTEALNEMDEIRDILIARSKKIYREAIISESLSLFDDAKEKFKEVQQISPSDSEYYEKATNRLKEYLE